MTLPAMLQELFGLVIVDEISNDCCDHENPARPEASEDEFCNVCFIVNLHNNCSEDEAEFTEETSEKQRDTIVDLWEQYAN